MSDGFVDTLRPAAACAEEAVVVGAPAHAVTRPALRYHGGKWRLAPWILRHIPPHRVYVEPFGGAASVLLRKQRSYAEIYNDLNEDVVNLFRVLRERDSAAALERLVALTPFSRVEFELAYEITEEPVERARRLLVRAFQGFGSTGTNGYGTGFRSTSSRSGSTPATDWRNFSPAIAEIADRLQGVVIEKRPAIELLARHDEPAAVFYVDPPYVHSTRGKRNPHCVKNRYAFELTDQEHRELAAALRSVRGMVVLSGYPCELYDRELFPDWERRDCPARADGARARTEVLWLNPACSEALHRARGLFSCEVAA